MLSLFLVLLIIAAGVSLTSNRNALFSICAIGFLQDPFRKMVPGEPIYFIVTVGLIFGLVFLKTVQSQSVSRLKEPFVGWSSSLQAPILMFCLVLAVQFMHSFLRYGNVIVSLIGLISYTAPFFAIMVGYFIVSRAQEVRIFMRAYALVGLLLAVTVILSYAGFDHRIFDEVGLGLTIYDQGTILRSYSGFMRTGEIAAWHIAASCCFTAILFFSAKSRPSTVWPLIALTVMIVAIALTGRRKMLMLVTIFGMIHGLGFSYYRRQLSLQYVAAAGAAVLVLWAAAQYLLSSGDGVSDYIARGTSVYNSATTRAIDLGFKPIGWAINRVGLFGGGLGIASQGSQLFNVSSIAGGSGEGGLGKIVVELGVPGLLAAFWLIMAFAAYINRSIKLSAQAFVPAHILPMMMGIAAFLLVNVMTFAVATQVYGDMFVLIVIGLLAGFLFALPKLVLNAMDEASASPHQTVTLRNVN